MNKSKYTTARLAAVAGTLRTERATQDVVPITVSMRADGGRKCFVAAHAAVKVGATDPAIVARWLRRWAAALARRDCQMELVANATDVQEVLEVLNYVPYAEHQYAMYYCKVSHRYFRPLSFHYQNLPTGERFVWVYSPLVDTRGRLRSDPEFNSLAPQPYLATLTEG